MGVGPIERMGDEHSPLAFSQIVASGLASQLGVAEDAKKIVAVLEGPSDGGAEVGHRLL